MRRASRYGERSMKYWNTFAANRNFSAKPSIAIQAASRKRVARAPTRGDLDGSPVERVNERDFWNWSNRSNCFSNHCDHRVGFACFGFYYQNTASEVSKRGIDEYSNGCVDRPSEGCSCGSYR